jgi:diguanylate cyclase (GGDEF)-like protein
MKTLIVEDDEALRKALREAVREKLACGEEQAADDAVHTASTLAEALSMIETHRYDAILLDLGLPDTVGTSAADHVREAAPDAAIVVFTGETDPRYARQLLRRGVQELLLKGQVSLDALGGALEQAMLRAEIVRDLEASSQRDPLTGVLNTMAIREWLQRAIRLAERRGSHVGVVFVDLDDFKQVNDSYGHATGDRVLQAVANRLQALLRASDGIGRVGGDEFVVVVEDAETLARCHAIAAKLREALNAPLVIDGCRIPLQASVGLGLYPDHGSTAEKLLMRADAAMYRAKRSRSEGRTA